MTREQCYTAAFQKQKDTLRYKQATFEAALQNIKDTNPNFEKINSRISFLGAQIATIAISGDTKSLKALQSEMTELSAARDAILKMASIMDIKELLI